MSDITIRRALISVSDKNGLMEFAKFLTDCGVEIISTGGTLKFLKDGGLPAKAVDDFTGFPEILDGRVKTLHPKIHGGLLGDIRNPSHCAQMEKNEIGKIDLLVVNLYPFEKTIAKPDVSEEEAIENIDIGGPAMLRSAAKNHAVTVSVTDIDDYKLIEDEMKKNQGKVSFLTAKRLALKVFSTTASYDSAIVAYFQNKSKDGLPDQILLNLKKEENLRYGENPHQKSAIYSYNKGKKYIKLQGKELSYNNLLDFDAALYAIQTAGDQSVAIIKHLNPCGIAKCKTLEESYVLAKRTDPVSAFGGIVGIHGKVDGNLASKITEIFVEGVIADAFTDEALRIFSGKPNIRLIQTDVMDLNSTKEIRQFFGGVLVQDRDNLPMIKESWKVVSKRKPDGRDLESLEFAWSCVRSIKSNAIVYTDSSSTLGIGAGQMSRVDSVVLGAMKAKKAGLSLQGAYAASDAFFPFRDGVDELAKEGVKAAIHPGGSIRDQEIVDAADENNMIMILTGTRHFRH